MRIKHLFFLLAIFSFINTSCNKSRSISNDIADGKESLQWWKDAKFGMFIHWGLYAIPAGTWKDKSYDKGYSEWIMYDEQIPVAEYEALAKQFNPVQFDADRWAQLAKDAGMKYMIITAKHHDGFAMFDSKVSDYDIVERTPFARDVISELREACHKRGIKFGCYYSIDRDWHHPLCSSNEHKQDNRWDYPDLGEKDFNKYLESYAIPQVRELLTNYQLDFIWFDGIGMKSGEQIHSLYQMIKSLNPNCLVNSRIKTYKFAESLPLVNCDYLSMGDNAIAEGFLDVGWENPGTMNTSYGYNKNDQNWHPTKKLIYYLVDITSKGGNYLLNVGPTDMGIIQKASSDRLLEMGKWLEINGEAIYNTTHWEVFGEGPEFDHYLKKNDLKEEMGQTSINENDNQNRPNIRFTKNGNIIYAICLEWPNSDVLLKSLSANVRHKVSAVSMLGSNEEIDWEQTEEGLRLSVPKEQVYDFAFTYKIVLN